MRATRRSSGGGSVSMLPVPPGHGHRRRIPVLLDLSDWNRLDDAAFRVSIRRSVRHLAWYEVAIGAAVVFCGVGAPLMPLVVVGAVLVCAGLWNLCRTSIEGMVVDGVAVILTGAFSASAWMWMDDARATGIARGIFVGAMQIVWGVRRIAFHRTARRAVNDPDAIAGLEAVVRDLTKRNAKTDLGAIEFRTGPLGRHRN